jgi:hypothetical protein
VLTVLDASPQMLLMEERFLNRATMLKIPKMSGHLIVTIRQMTETFTQVSFTVGYRK